MGSTASVRNVTKTSPEDFEMMIAECPVAVVEND